MIWLSKLIGMICSTTPIEGNSPLRSPYPPGKGSLLGFPALRLRYSDTYWLTLMTGVDRFFIDLPLSLR
uniref:Uncharacterized protein n=1 Tax=Picea glauca TaxID=3330 RepID=A0A117NFU2_PICGL|nr:hypothetical protein ABT39_MTgene2169 [Picea glauca]QHR86999.1 hypothetical protein Q903MT_gene1008 [Picea sitchensis]